MTALKIRYYVLDFIIFFNTSNLPTVLSFKVKINSIPTKISGAPGNFTLIKSTSSMVYEWLQFNLTQRI